MTIKKMQEDVMKKYPRAYCLPTKCLGLPGQKNWTEYTIVGRNKSWYKEVEIRYKTRKEAWTAAYEELKSN